MLTAPTEQQVRVDSIRRATSATEAPGATVSCTIRTGPTAVAEFEAHLPAAIFLFNGVSVPQAAVTGARHPHAYKAAHLRSVASELAHELDLVLVNDAFSYCCICTHEWQALAHPIFLHAAA
jgi:hypothetical protein